MVYSTLNCVNCQWLMQRKAVKVTWWRVSSASNFNWNKTRANFSFRTYIIPVAPWRFSLLIVGYDIGGLANYEEAPWGYSQAEWERQEKPGLVRRNDSRSFHVDYMYSKFLESENVSIFFCFLLFVKFPPSHVGLLQIFLLNIMIQLPRFFWSIFFKTEINSPHQRPCSAVLFIFHTQYSTSK